MKTTYRNITDQVKNLSYRSVTLFSSPGTAGTDAAGSDVIRDQKKRRRSRRPVHPAHFFAGPHCVFHPTVK